MSDYLFSPRITRLTNLLTSAKNIAEGETIRIWSISIQSLVPDTGSTTTFKSGDGNTTLFVWTSVQGMPVHIDIPFIADTGLQISSTSNSVVVTVLHSSGGA